MPSAPIKVEAEIARRFLRRALLLDNSATSVASVLDHLGYLQIDPINVCGRMHDLIARNRVPGYREGDLMRHLHGNRETLPPERRSAFEHHFPADGGTSSGILAAFPLAAWPHLVRAMRTRSKRPGAWSGQLTRAQREAARRVLSEIAARGPLSSEDFDEPGRSRAVWGAATLVKSTMQKLFFHGDLLIARHSDSNRRSYDLPERVLPDSVRNATAPSVDEAARWAVTTRLRQRRLAVLKRKELPLVEDLVQAIAVDGCPPLHCLREDLPLLESDRGFRSLPEVPPRRDRRSDPTARRAGPFSGLRPCLAQELTSGALGSSCVDNDEHRHGPDPSPYAPGHEISAADGG